jgi:biotin carboxyl carrier protein
MPGLVLKILVKAGDGVTKGDPLLILESMKMENVLKAGQNGVIAEIGIKEGDSVEKSHVLLRYR